MTRASTEESYYFRDCDHPYHPLTSGGNSVEGVAESAGERPSRVSGHHSPRAEDRPANQPGDDDAHGHGRRLRQKSGIPCAAPRSPTTAAEDGEPTRRQVRRGQADHRTLQVNEVR